MKPIGKMMEAYRKVKPLPQHPWEYVVAPRKVPMISKTPERQSKKSTKKVVLKHGCFVLD